MQKRNQKRVRPSTSFDKEETISGIIFSRKNIVSFVLVAIKLAVHILKQNKEK